MMLGEYGVLYGLPALVCAIDKRITVTLTSRDDNNIVIESATHGRYTTNIDSLTIEQPFQFVLAALKQYQAVMRRGCDIQIEANFSDQVGFGSSAAVTTATLAALTHWMNNRPQTDKHELLLRQGRHVVRQVQGVGSGADVAASIYGGMVGFQTQPLLAERMMQTHPLTVLYSGYKTKTADAIKQIQARFAEHPRVFKALANGIGKCAEEGIQWVRKGQWQRLGEVMSMQQGLMEALGVSDATLRGMVDRLRDIPGIFGAKISGAGLGDCVIGLGEVGAVDGMEAIPLTMTLQGVICEKI